MRLPIKACHFEQTSRHFLNLALLLYTQTQFQVNGLVIVKYELLITILEEEGKE